MTRLIIGSSKTVVISIIFALLLGDGYAEDAPVVVDDAVLRHQAEQYIAFKRNRLSAKKKLDWMAECLAHPEENIFCTWIPNETLQSSDESEKGSTSDANETKSHSIAELVKFLEKDKPGEFNSVSERRIHRALRSFKKWDGLKPIVDSVLSSSRCYSPALITALGHKAEEFFPEMTYRELALKLFTRASECGKDYSAQKAQYRAGLLHIWKGECAQADRLFAPLSEDVKGDYLSRSLYWRAHCAQKHGNKLYERAFRTRLLKENPLGYHGLILAQGKPKNLKRFLSDREFETLARTEVRPELNETIRAIEMLHRLKASHLAVEILNRMETDLSSTEIPFRLYTVTLRNQAGDSIGQFRSLAGIFRQDPASISRETLKLFYPLKNFYLLKRHGKNRVDPYLLAALIRQESGFNSHARSPVGALGLMQLMPATARSMQRRVSRRALLNPNVNIRLGVKYFERLLKRFDNDAELSLAAYNAGPMNVQEWVRRYPVENRLLFFDLIPYKETRNYVALIARNYFWYKNLYGDSDDSTPSGQLLFTLNNSI